MLLDHALGKPGGRARAVVAVAVNRPGGAALGIAGRPEAAADLLEQAAQVLEVVQRERPCRAGIIDRRVGYSGAAASPSTNRARRL